MTDYTQVDAALLAEIKAGRNATWALTDATNHLTKPMWSHWYLDGMRVVDRRLQALKKAGEIKYSRATGWVIAVKKVSI